MNNLQLITFKRCWVMILGLACGLAVGPAAGDEPAVAEARKWLENLETTLEQTSYRGVFVYARGPEVNAMRIIHRYSEGIVTERLSQLDGGNGEILRHGNEVVCILPNRGRLKLDAVIPAGPFSSVFPERLRPLSSWYQPSQLADGRIAGFETVVIAVKARDSHRYSYRLWLERQTGLLLKSQVRDSQDRVIERFQFTQLEITDAITDRELQVPTAGRQVRRITSAESADSAVSSTDTSESAASAGFQGQWQPGWTPDGFVPFGSRADQGFQLTAFSDGIASFSIFVEPMGKMDMPEGASRIGATTAYLHRVQAREQVYLVTVVGEIPPETAMRVAESVEPGDATAND